MDLPELSALQPADSSARQQIKLNVMQDTFSPPSIALTDEILERPLFNKDRRPWEDVKAETEAKSVDLRLQLEGIVITSDKKIALVKDLVSKEFLQLRIGEQHKGWLVHEVTPGRAVLKRGDKMVELVIKLEKNSNEKTNRARFSKPNIRKKDSSRN